jgi:hypothetical protein
VLLKVPSISWASRAGQSACCLLGCLFLKLRSALMGERIVSRASMVE